MIDITKDNKNGTTTVVEYRKVGDDVITSNQVTVSKKKVKTAKGDFETIKVTSKPEYASLDTIATLLNIMEAVG